LSSIENPLKDIIAQLIFFYNSPHRHFKAKQSYFNSFYGAAPSFWSILAWALFLHIGGVGLGNARLLSQTLKRSDRYRFKLDIFLIVQPSPKFNVLKTFFSLTKKQFQSIFGLTF